MTTVMFFPRGAWPFLEGGRQMATEIPEGSVAFVLEVLELQKGPLRRRKLLESLEQRGHRISLAGLNRILQVCRERGLTVEGPEGVRASQRRAA